MVDDVVRSEPRAHGQRVRQRIPWIDGFLAGRADVLQHFAVREPLCLFGRELWPCAGGRDRAVGKGGEAAGAGVRAVGDDSVAIELGEFDVALGLAGDADIAQRRLQRVLFVVALHEDTARRDAVHVLERDVAVDRYQHALRLGVVARADVDRRLDVAQADVAIADLIDHAAA